MPLTTRSGLGVTSCSRARMQASAGVPCTAQALMGCDAAAGVSDAGTYTASALRGGVSSPGANWARYCSAGTECTNSGACRCHGRAHAGLFPVRRDYGHFSDLGQRARRGPDPGGVDTVVIGKQDFQEIPSAFMVGRSRSAECFTYQDNSHTKLAAVAGTAASQIADGRHWISEAMPVV